jgi:DSF synthase
MAVAYSEFRNLIGRTDNDNQPGFFAVKTSQPARLPKIRTDTLELEYANLATRLEPESGMLWAHFLHRERACFTSELLSDLTHFQQWLRDEFGSCTREEMPFRHLVWGSRSPTAWNMGGNLASFTSLIRDQNEAALRSYAYHCIDILYDNYRGLDLPVMTVALVQGDAIGGGFEAMLTNDVVIAERTAKFGLPEILFNLFPGMGAHSFLRRRVGDRLARLLIEDGKSRSAEEMHELGLVDVVCEPGEGEATLRRFVADRRGRFTTDLALKRARQRTDLLTKAELVEIVDMWVELALDLGEPELRRMDCLARHQERRRAHG